MLWSTKAASWSRCTAQGGCRQAGFKPTPERERERERKRKAATSGDATGEVLSREPSFRFIQIASIAPVRERESDLLRAPCRLLVEEPQRLVKVLEGLRVVPLRLPPAQRAARRNCDSSARRPRPHLCHGLLTPPREGPDLLVLRHPLLDLDLDPQQLRVLRVGRQRLPPSRRSGQGMVVLWRSIGPRRGWRAPMSTIDDRGLSPRGAQRNMLRQTFSKVC